MYNKKKLILIVIILIKTFYATFGSRGSWVQTEYVDISDTNIQSYEINQMTSQQTFPVQSQQ